MSQMYPVKKPMIRPFLMPQRCAEVRFLSYLGRPVSGFNVTTLMLGYVTNLLLKDSTC